MKTFVVYMATNISNGHRYVGYTSNGLSRRRTAHLGRARRREDGCEKFCHAIRKYGEDAFTWAVLATFCTHAEALAEEIRLIAALKPEYNLTAGGEGTPGLIAWNRKPVTCLEDGKIFPSATSAAAAYGLTVINVAEVCMGKYRSAQGEFHFVYGDVKYGLKTREQLIRKIEKAHAENRKRVNVNAGLSRYRGIIDGKDVAGRSAAGPAKLSRAIICVEDDKEFPSINAAARHYNLDNTAISELCAGKRGRKTVGGFKFKYADRTIN